MPQEDIKEDIDSVLAFFIMKRLITPIVRSKAYKFGLVDRDGKTIKEPETDEEKMSLGLLDKFVFKLKRIMGSKLAQLNSFMYLQAVDSEFYKNIMLKGGIEQRAIVKRVKSDMQKILEKYDMNHEEFLKTVLLEEIRKKENEI